jgi:hypothetical protein
MSRNRWLLLLFSGVITTSSVSYGLLGRSSAENEISSTISVMSLADDELSEAVRLYHEAEKSLSTENNDAALRLIEEARHYRLSLSRLQASSAPTKDISSIALLLRLSKNLSDHALRAAKQGERADALSFVRAARSLSEHVMETPTATLEALQTGRALDQSVGRAEVAVLEHLGESVPAHNAFRREQALREFYNTHMMPAIVTAARQRERLIGVRDAAPLYQECDRNDAALAALLLGQYSRERLRLLRQS